MKRFKAKDVNPFQKVTDAYFEMVDTMCKPVDYSRFVLIDPSLCYHGYTITKEERLLFKLAAKWLQQREA